MPSEHAANAPASAECGAWTYQHLGRDSSVSVSWRGPGEKGQQRNWTCRTEAELLVVRMMVHHPCLQPWRRGPRVDE